MQEVIYRFSGVKRTNINGKLLPSWMWTFCDFAEKEDAVVALELFKKLGIPDSGVEYYIQPKVFLVESQNYYEILQSKYYFKSLNEFINSDMMANNIKKLGINRNEINKLLEEINVTMNNKKQQQKIIERMIRDYQYQIKINQNLPVDVESYKENVKFLEDLRDGKIELNK